MIICKGCGSQFPNRTIYNGKELYLNKRSYCLVCFPPGSKRGYEFRKKASKERRPNSKCCKICDRTYPTSKNNICSTCRSWYLRYCCKSKAVTFLGGKCVKCGNKDHECLAFHHIDSNKKDFTLSENWGNKDWNVLIKEIEKCELLCHNCHAKIHYIEKLESHLKIIEYYESILKKD